MKESSVVIRTHGNPAISKAIADALLLQENNRLRDEIARLNKQLDMMRMARERENGRKLRELRTTAQFHGGPFTMLILRVIALCCCKTTRPVRRRYGHAA